MADRAPSAHPALEEDMTPSFTSRLSQSASGLARDLVSSSGRSSITSALAANVADSGKGFASSSGSSAGLGTWAQQNPTTGIQGGAVGPLATPGESFRSVDLRHGDKFRQLNASLKALAEEAEILGQLRRNNVNPGGENGPPTLFESGDRITENADYDEVATRVEAAWIEQYHTSLKGKGKERQSSTDSPQLTKPDGTSWAWIRDFNVSDNGRTKSDHGNDQNYLAGSKHSMLNEDDGAEVVALLSNSRSTVGLDTLEAEMNDVADVSAEDLFGGSMTDGEEKATERIKSALPPPAEHGHVSPQNPLNLRPNPEALLERIHGNLEADVSSTTYEARMQGSLNKWDGVLNHYTDAVWGSFVPQVEDAKEQFRDIVEGTTPTNTQAVRRLEMIFNHLRLSEGTLILHHKRSLRAEMEAAVLAKIEAAILALQAVSSGGKVPLQQLTAELNVLNQKLRTVR